MFFSTLHQARCLKEKGWGLLGHDLKTSLSALSLRVMDKLKTWTLCCVTLVGFNKKQYVAVVLLILQRNRIATCFVFPHMSFSRN